MSTRQTISYLVLALLVGCGIGRFSLPAKIVTKTEIVQSDTKQSDTDSNKQDHTVIVVTRTTAPDGTVTEVTETRKDVVTDTEKKTTEHSDSDTKSSTETTYNTQKWSLSALAVDKPLHPQGLVYGGHIQYRILGPFQIGALGLTDGTVGLSLGITF